MKPVRGRSLIIASLAVVAIAGVATAALTTTTSSTVSSADFALRTVNTSDGRMVVNGGGMTVYIYLPDQTHPSETTCVGDCANDWPPVVSTSRAPKISGLDRSRVGLLQRLDGSLQLTLNGYPLYRFAADHRPGETRGESVGNTWFAVGPYGGFLALPVRSFQSTSPHSDQTVQVATTPAGRIVADNAGQTLYAYKDDTPTTSACTASWCTQDWPPLLVSQPPTAINGIGAQLDVLRRADGTLQLTLAGHPLYRFSGDYRPGDLLGLGIGRDWYPVAPDGSKVGAVDAQATGVSGREGGI